MNTMTYIGFTDEANEGIWIDKDGNGASYTSKLAYGCKGG